MLQGGGIPIRSAMCIQAKLYVMAILCNEFPPFVIEILVGRGKSLSF